MTTDIGQTLAEFAVNTPYSAIPKEVVDFAKGLTLKTVAGMVVGATKPAGGSVAGLIKGRNLPHDASILGHNFKTGLWEAVFLNAFCAHASELEDDSFLESGGTGWDITVIPLMFPLAEKEKLSGQDFLQATILGLEVHHRTCMFSGTHVGLGIVPPAVGPAAAAAKALGLSIKETKNAIGLATSGVNLWRPNFGTDAHFFESAMQAMQGMMAADLAREGMTANSDVGLFLSKLLGEQVIPEKIVEDLGKRWVFGETWVKKYPSCFITHRSIDTVIELAVKHRLTYDDIESVEVHVRPEDALCDRPNPKTEGDIQFSFQHTLGSAILNGDVCLEHITERCSDDPRLADARSKVKVIIRPELLGKGFLTPHLVVIKTKDGRMFSGERAYAIGSPKDPLTMEQFGELYRKFTRGVLPSPVIDRTAQLIMNLEDLGDIRELTKILAKRYTL